MERYHGADYAAELKKKRQAQTTLKEKRAHAVDIARGLFSTKSMSSPGAGETAAHASAMLNRRNQLLPTKAAHRDFYGKMPTLAEQERVAHPDALMDEIAPVMKSETAVLLRVYEKRGMDRDGN